MASLAADASSACDIGDERDFEEHKHAAVDAAACSVERQECFFVQIAPGIH